MAYDPRDHFYKKAKKEKFAARSIYKLEEIDARHHLLKKGHKILDLGAAPGSWSQYCSRKIGKDGLILGIDLKKIEITLPNAVFTQGDIHDLTSAKVFELAGDEVVFDGVISDMAPNTTGIKITDQARSLELCEMAFEKAKEHLRKGGFFICKIFHGGDFNQFKSEVEKLFSKVKVIRPKSTRQTSTEVFILGINYVEKK